MMRRGLLLLLLAASGAAGAADCSIDARQMERGERRPVLACGSGLVPGSRLQGLGQAGISVDYEQYLRRCSVGQPGPGLFLWLSAGADARTASLRVSGPSGQPLCQDMEIRVPPRRLLENVRQEFSRRRPQLVELAVDCDALEQGWENRISFPQAPWLAQMQVVPGSVVACRRGTGRLTLEWKSGPRLPAAVVLGEAIVWVQPPEPAWHDDMKPEQARYVDVNGYRTRYFETGRGEDVIILVHGGQPDPVSPTAESWRANFRALAKDFRVIAYDVLGSGYTDPPRNAEEYSRFYTLVAEHLYGLIRALDIRRAHLVGSSQGGWPVLRVALDHPGVVKCAVSVDTVMTPFTADAPGLKVFAYALGQVHPAAGPTRESMLRSQLLVSHTWNNQGWDEIDESMQLMQLPKLLEAKNAMAALRMSPGHPVFRKLREQALAELQSGKMQVPQLVVWGHNDPLATFSQGLDYFRAASASPAPVQLVVINNAGHVAQAEYPEQFNAAVLGFCGQFRAR